MIRGGDSEKITDLSVSVGFTAEKLRPTSGIFLGFKAYAATIQPVGGSVHINWHGVTATEDHMKLEEGQVAKIEGFEDLANFRCIEGDVDVALKVHYDYEV